MRNRHKAFGTTAVAFCLFLGWQMNNGYRAVALVVHKAQVCDKLPGGCEQIALLGEQLSESLPPAKSLVLNENKNRMVAKK